MNNPYLTKLNKSRIGIPRSQEVKDKISKSKIGKPNLGGQGENNGRWKGDEVGYLALHNWVSHRLGKPTKCEHCGKDGLTGRQIDWANKSGQYKRDLTDWIRLCKSCHKIYDAGIPKKDWSYQR